MSTDPKQPRRMSGSDAFDVLYDVLAEAWESHQSRRASHAQIAELAATSAQLDMARAAMWAWWKENRIETR